MNQKCFITRSYYARLTIYFVINLYRPVEPSILYYRINGLSQQVWVRNRCHIWSLRLYLNCSLVSGKHIWNKSSKYQFKEWVEELKSHTSVEARLVTVFKVTTAIRVSSLEFIVHISESHLNIPIGLSTSVCFTRGAPWLLSGNAHFARVVGGGGIL